MPKSFPGLVVVTFIFVGLVAGEITVTFEPHNQTEEATLYGENSGNLHSIDQSQGHDEEEVETFYVRSGVSEADENRSNVPATQTHSPITEPDDRQLAIEPVMQKVYWPTTGESQQCPDCQVQPPQTYPQYPTHPVFPSLGGGESHRPVENDAEYINGGGGGQQVVFINPPQQPDYHPSPPVFSPLQPDYPVQQQPTHPSIIYVPYLPSASSGPPQLPWYGNEEAGGHFDDGFNDERFSGGSAHRNHEQIWRLHQQQHQLWLQQQRQHQQQQFSSIVIGGGDGDGFNTIGNLGTVGRRPCDSKK